MGYDGFSLNEFSLRFVPWRSQARGRKPVRLEGQGAGFVHRASLAIFLIICKKLSRIS
jgi:hypothetical protein